MPHGKTLRWWARNSDELSPIGQLLTDYMRDHRLAGQAELAKIIGVTQQSVSDYLKPIIVRDGRVVSKPRIPRPAVLLRIAQATKRYDGQGIPLATLYVAAGIYMDGISLDIQDPAPPPPPRRVAPLRLPADTPHTAREALYRRIESLDKLTVEERQTILNELEDVLRGRDPYRRYRVGEALVVDADAPTAADRAETSDMPEKAPHRRHAHSTKAPGTSAGNDGAE